MIAEEEANASNDYTDSDATPKAKTTKKTPEKSSMSKETKQQFLKDKLGVKASTAKKAVESDSDDFEQYSEISDIPAGDQALPTKEIKPAYDPKKPSPAAERLRKIEEQEKKEERDAKLEAITKKEMAALESSEAEPSARDKAASPVKKSAEKRSEAKKAFMEKTGKDVSDESEV